MSAEDGRGGIRTALRAVAVLSVAGFVALLAYGLAANAPHATITDRLDRGELAAAPGFELAALSDGGRRGNYGGAWRRAAADQRVDLGELRGTPIVLNFWASWCAPCRSEAPALRRAAERWRERGVLFVGLNMQDVPEDARTFLREFALKFPQVREATNATARRWGVNGIPATFFISRRGDIVGHAIGTLTRQQIDDGANAAKLGRTISIGAGGDRRPPR